MLGITHSFHLNILPRPDEGSVSNAVAAQRTVGS